MYINLQSSSRLSYYFITHNYCEPRNGSFLFTRVKMRVTSDATKITNTLRHVAPLSMILRCRPASGGLPSEAEGRTELTLIVVLPSLTKGEGPGKRDVYIDGSLERSFTLAASYNQLLYLYSNNGHQSNHAMSCRALTLMYSCCLSGFTEETL